MPETVDRYTDSVVGAFSGRLREIVIQAQARTLGALQRDLEIDADGVIEQTPANVRVLAKIDALFQSQMKALGYDNLVTAFVSQFPSQIPFFQDALKQISQRLKVPLPKVQFGPRDLRLFGAQQIASANVLSDVVGRAGEAAKRQASLSIGGLDFSKLVEELSRQFNRSISECAGLAATSMSTFYRMVTERGYTKIQQNLPERQLLFRYEGPQDRVTRPFCEALLKGKRTYTREEIDHMDNGQIPNVFVTCGGFSCRHQWVLNVLNAMKPAKEEVEEETENGVRR